MRPAAEPAAETAVSVVVTVSLFLAAGIATGTRAAKVDVPAAVKDFFDTPAKGRFPPAKMRKPYFFKAVVTSAPLEYRP